MQAMILAAGLGSRLRPLTSHLPKPLFPVLNTPSVRRILDGLKAAGFKKIVINACHLTNLLIGAISGWNLGQEIVIVKEPFLLGTGGALKNAMPCLEDGPILLINSDVVTDIDLKAVFEVHCQKHPIATMVLHDHPTFNSIKVTGRRVSNFGFKGRGALAFTGISVIESALIRSMPDHFPSSLIDTLSDAIGAGEDIIALMADELKPGYLWEDIGSVRGYLAAHEALLKKKGWTVFAGADSNLQPDTSIDGWCVMGDGVKVGRGVTLSRSVIWDGCAIEDGEYIKDSIVTPYGRLGLNNGPFA
ncbi:MAG: sugar phosphate nucleotidyltransferase [Dissulfurimicrobium sp.]|uniref:sugar phosphate nucleotidyltransferase n=1 Tax=Dissulfurimicrobium sp. TaxID=2022436 RepID=UPI003D0A2DE6